MTARFHIEITHGHAAPHDIARAEEAVRAALVKEHLDTTEALAAAHAEYMKREDGEAHDAVLAEAFDHVQTAGELALMEGWHDICDASMVLNAA
ncbi:hypothetical protein [Methylovirgula sp. 4M-Z18]|uniref:hypothetical protein n=1 Tax=Methylovirgula sp. 4M-Z18 TaxID=2293567 RepID=UPI000E2E9CC7|nr:hypothetical protein [Methylovirgula sp. 4M-Z18]